MALRLPALVFFVEARKLAHILRLQHHEDRPVLNLILAIRFLRSGVIIGRYHCPPLRLQEVCSFSIRYSFLRVRIERLQIESLVKYRDTTLLQRLI